MAGSTYTRKPRGENWRIEEELALMKAYGDQKEVIEGKFSTGISLQHKWKAWEAVSVYVCSLGGPQRSTEECKAKLKNIKAKAKKKRDEAILDVCGRPITLTQAELIFLEMENKSKNIAALWDSDNTTEDAEAQQQTQLQSGSPVPSSTEDSKQPEHLPVRGIKREHEDEDDDLDINVLRREILILKKEKLEEERDQRKIKFNLEVEKLKLEIEILKAKPL